MAAPPVRIALRGHPKVGKTTVVDRTIERLIANGVRVGGFVTREIRPGDHRAGFRVCAVNGPDAVMAHLDFDTGVTVSRYGVDVDAFERVALPALAPEAIADHDVVIIDEVARMELESQRFAERLRDVAEAGVSMLATVHIYRHPVTDALLARPDVSVMVVTEANRERLPDWLAARLTWR